MKTHRIYVNGKWYTACTECGEIQENCKCQIFRRGEDFEQYKTNKETREKDR